MNNEAASRITSCASRNVEKLTREFAESRNPEKAFQVIFICSSACLPLPQIITDFVAVGLLKRKQDGESLDVHFGFSAGRGETPPIYKPAIKARQFGLMVEMQTLQAEFCMSAERSAEMVAARLSLEVESGERAKSKSYSVETLLRLWRSEENRAHRKYLAELRSSSDRCAADLMDDDERSTYVLKYPRESMTPEMRKVLSVPR